MSAGSARGTWSSRRSSTRISRSGSVANRSSAASRRAVLPNGSNGAGLRSRQRSSISEPSPASGTFTSTRHCGARACIQSGRRERSTATRSLASREGSARRCERGSRARAQACATIRPPTVGEGGCRRSSGSTAAPVSRVSAAARRSTRSMQQDAAPGTARPVSSSVREGSRPRRRYRGSRNRVRSAGYFGWRAAIDFDDLSLVGTFSESWGPRFRVGLITLGSGRLYWFVSELAPDDEPLPPDPQAYFRDRLHDWHRPIPEVVEATPAGALSRLPIHDRPPLEAWGCGRVTLLGDAAHPMTPNLGQGAAQALEDAVVLALALRNESDPIAALRAYEAARIPRTTMIVKRSYQFGRIAQLGNPLACRMRDPVMKATPKRIQRRQQELVIRPGFDP